MRVIGAQSQGDDQQAVAEATGIHVNQIRRYEGGKSQPTVDVLRRLALELSISSDALLFDDDGRGASDDLKLQFEAASRLDEDERRVVKELIEGMLLKHEAKRWTATA